MGTLDFKPKTAMKTLITFLFAVCSMVAFGQDRPKTSIVAEAQTSMSDTVSTLINFGVNNMARLKQLDTNQRKYDSLIQVQRTEILDVILSSHNIELKDVVKIEPKPEGKFIIKTIKK